MITALIIILNAIVFYYINILNPSLISTYGISAENFNTNITWLTNIFVHANAMHIIMNMLFLAQIGFILEKRIGSLNFFLIYIISAIGANIASYLYITYTGENLLVIGASGAIFGIFAYFSLYFRNFKSFIIQVIVFHIIIIIANLPVAWYSHFGGSILGIAAYYLNIGFYSKTKFEFQDSE